MQGALRVSDQDEDLSGHGSLLQNISEPWQHNVRLVSCYKDGTERDDWRKLVHSASNH